MILTFILKAVTFWNIVIREHLCGTQKTGEAAIICLELRIRGTTNKTFSKKL